MEAMLPRATTTQQALPPRATVLTGAAGATAIPSAAPLSHRDAPLQAAHGILLRARGLGPVTQPSNGEAAEPNGDEGKHRFTRSSTTEVRHHFETLSPLFCCAVRTFAPWPTTMCVQAASAVSSVPFLFRL